MRRRLTDAHTGLGNPSPEIFNNQWTDNENFNNAARAFFDDILQHVKDFDEIGGFDFNITLMDDGFKIVFGIEPAYKYDPYICYCFDSNVDKSYIQKGKANGYYGSDIVINKELLFEKCNKGFKDCINKNHDSLMACIKK